jgi:hypothetical protein
MLAHGLEETIPALGLSSARTVLVYPVRMPPLPVQAMQKTSLHFGGSLYGTRQTGNREQR